AVAVCCHENVLAGFQIRGNELLPAGFDTLEGCGKRFGRGQVDDAGVALVVRGMAFVVGLERGRRGCVAAAPDEDLLVPVLRSRFGLVQALERAVMPLVEPPAPY